ncbi:MAG: MepB family protein [Cyclobacteriaceae bacterium]
MSIPADLLLLQHHVFNPCGFSYTTPQREAESAEYEAHFFKINDLVIRYRKAKITPTKSGQFVTFWKREGDGPIQPYGIEDNVDVLIVCVRNDNHFGVFVFSRTILVSQGIISTDKKEGKRALRVYPPWDIPTSKQALKTQKWQQECFLEVKSGECDINRVGKLFKR